MSGRFITSSFNMCLIHPSSVVPGSPEYQSALLEMSDKLSSVIEQAAHIEKNFGSVLSKPVVIEVFADYTAECISGQQTHLSGLSMKTKTELTTFRDISEDAIHSLANEALGLVCEDMRRTVYFLPPQFEDVTEARLVVVFVET